MEGNVTTREVTVNKETGEPVQLKNPLEQSNFSFTSFFIGNVFAFWYVLIRQFWWWIPVMAALMFYFVDSGAVLKLVEEGTISVGSILKNAGFWSLIASVWCVFPPWIIATKMKKGIAVTKGQIAAINIPGTLMALIVFYDLAFAIYLMVIGG